jgi:hypothetical protein
VYYDAVVGDGYTDGGGAVGFCQQSGFIARASQASIGITCQHYSDIFRRNANARKSSVDPRIVLFYISYSTNESDTFNVRERCTRHPRIRTRTFITTTVKSNGHYRTSFSASFKVSCCA